MSNRLYTAVIVVLWLAAITWLVTDRILPPFFGDEAPISRSPWQQDPVAWKIQMDGKGAGFAVLQAVPGDSGTREVHSLLRLSRMAPPKAAPLWLRPLIKPLSDLSLETRTITMFDPLGRLASFRTTIGVDQSDLRIKVSGNIVGEELRVRLRVPGMLDKRVERPWPDRGALGADMTPETRLLPLYEGRRWRQEWYSPFAPPNEPFEMIEAAVVERLVIDQGDDAIEGWRVEYRTLEKTGRSEQGRVRANLYVATDGRVMRQETFLLGSRLEFLRQSDEQSERLAADHLDLATHASTTRPDWSPAVPNDDHAASAPAE